MGEGVLRCGIGRLIEEEGVKKEFRCVKCGIISSFYVAN